MIFFIFAVPENELDEIIRKKNDKRGNVVSLPSGVLTVNVSIFSSLPGTNSEEKNLILIWFWYSKNRLCIHKILYKKNQISMLVFW